MDPVTAVRTCFQKYADFNGRASRPEFWWFYLFTVLVIMVAYFAQFLVSLVISAVQFGVGDGRLGVFTGLFSLVTNMAMLALYVGLMIPLLAAGSRRLHDRNQSGWLLLLLLVPCASIALIVLWVLEGTPGPNNFGPPPTWAAPPPVNQ